MARGVGSMTNENDSRTILEMSTLEVDKACIPLQGSLYIRRVIVGPNHEVKLYILKQSVKLASLIDHSKNYEVTKRNY